MTTTFKQPRKKVDPPAPVKIAITIELADQRLAGDLSQRLAELLGLLLAPRDADRIAAEIRAWRRREGIADDDAG